jgi:hypothetical protein
MEQSSARERYGRHVVQDRIIRLEQFRPALTTAESKPQCEDDPGKDRPIAARILLRA